MSAQLPSAGSTVGDASRAHAEATRAEATPVQPALPGNWRECLPNPAGYYKQRIESLTPANSAGWAQGRCPFHDDNVASISVQLDGARGNWRCFAGCGTGDMVEFHQRVTGLPFVSAVRDLLALPTLHITATGSRTETPEQAARRFAAPALNHGYTWQALHEYQSADGEPFLWRIRLKHPKSADATRDKWIRPMHRAFNGYVLGNPDRPSRGWPIYRLPELAANTSAPVVIVEGESCADALVALGIVATTSGSCDSAGGADWTPLRGRHCIVWPDNDGPGTKYACAVTAKLHMLGCDVRMIDVGELALPEKGDCVDWLNDHPSATSDDVLSLPTVEVPALRERNDAGGSEALTIIEAAIERTQTDPEAAYSKETIAALVRLKVQDPAEFIRARRRLKAAHSQVTLSDIDRLIQANGSEFQMGTASTTDLLVEMVRRHAELFHSPAGDAFATIKDKSDGREVAQTWALTSSGFTEWMAARAWNELQLAIGDAVRNAAIATLAGIAKFDGGEFAVYLRCAPSEDGAGTVLDLTNDHWQAVEITRVGWSVVDQTKVRFWRPKNARPLPLPERGGDLPELWRFANVAESDRPLVLAWLLESFRPSTDFPILELVAEQGCAKSVTQTVLRNLVDPNEVPLRAAPKAVEDVFIAARNGWLASFNNLSRLTAQQQDALCSLATPGGYASRTLYTNGEETAWNTQRPVVINGISTLATAPDLVDRTIHIEPPRLMEYKKSSDLWAEFTEVQPRILGALLDLFAAMLFKLPSVHIEKPPRLADFAHLGEAMMQVQGAEPGAFMALYNANREHAALRSLDASPVAQAVMSLIDQRGWWEGTYKTLLEALASYRPDSEAWPRSARGLADALRRSAPSLRLAGYSVADDSTRRTDGYHVALAKRHPEHG